MSSDRRIRRLARRLAVAVLAAGLVVLTGIGIAAAGGARIAGCRVLAADNAFKQRVDRLPVARGSVALIARIGLAARVYPDFGTRGMTSRSSIRARCPTPACPVIDAALGGPRRG